MASRRPAHTDAASNCSAASAGAAAEWRGLTEATSSRACAASSTVENESKPSPVGSQSEKPVSWTTAGRPHARNAQVRSLNQPERGATYACCAIPNSPALAAIKERYADDDALTLAPCVTSQPWRRSSAPA